MLVPLAVNDVLVTPMIVKSFFYVKSVTVLKSEGALARTLSFTRIDFAWLPPPSRWRG